MEIIKHDFSKKVGWETRLEEHIEAHRYKKFRWGQNDCVTFSLTSMNKITQMPAFECYTPRWKNKREAVMLLKKAGVRSWIEIIELHLEKNGLWKIPTLMAQRGDLAIIDTDQGLGVGVVYFDKVLHPGPKGLCATKITDAKRVWRYS